MGHAVPGSNRLFPALAWIESRFLASELLDRDAEAGSMRERRRSPRYQADQEIYARIKSSIPVSPL